MTHLNLSVMRTQAMATTGSCGACTSPPPNSGGTMVMHQHQLGKSSTHIYVHIYVERCSNISKIPFNLFTRCHRTPAMIGCSFVANREFFGKLGLLDPGMDVYGGENIELGIKVCWSCSFLLFVFPLYLCWSRIR